MADTSDKAARRRGPGRPFQKGVSGNPGGRKPVPEDVKEALDAMTLPAALRLASLVNSADETVALKASIHVLDRNLGKALQSIEVNDLTERDGLQGMLALLPEAIRVLTAKK